MNRILGALIMLVFASVSYAQIDSEQLALDVSKANSANEGELTKLIWKKYSTVTIDGEVKATGTTEISFDESGNIIAKHIDGKTTVKQKRGIRGRIQQSSAESKIEYLEAALNLSLAYTFMSKGELLDFFEGGTITEKGDQYEVAGGNVHVKDDKLTILINKETLLFEGIKFSSFLDEDPISGELDYDLFSSGVSHVSTTVLNLPAKKAVINAENKDYTQRIN